MSQIYTVASGKGGTGKSTTAVNLGSALNKFNQEVIIIDTNLTTPNIGLYFGMPVAPVTLNHVLQEKARVEEAIYEHESGVKIIPSSLSLKDIKKLNYGLLDEIARKLKKNFDQVIFDCAAGLGEEAKLAVSVGEEIIVVTNPNILSVTDALKTIKLSEELGKKVKGVIITKVNGGRSEMSVDSIKEMLEVPILGIVPEDKAVDDSLARKNSAVNLYPRSRAAKEYTNIAAKILGKKKKPETFSEKLARLLGFG